MTQWSRSAHESLTELNITPLLDLAFVLLVIFIITTIPPVKDMDLKLPTASKHEKDPPRKAYFISVQADGNLFIDREEIKMNELLPRLIGLRTVIVRGDGKAKYKQIRDVLDLCQQANIGKLDLATDVARK
jgi:biopolymer transport protein ExbD